MYNFHNPIHGLFMSMNEKRIQDIDYYIENNDDVSVAYKIYHISDSGIKKSTVAKKSLSDIDINEDSGVYYSLLRDFNDELPGYMEKKNIKFFVPKGRPDCKINNNTIKLYYYHDTEAYKLMDHSKYPKVVNAPDGAYRRVLEDLYAVHYDIAPPFRSWYYRYKK